MARGSELDVCEYILLEELTDEDNFTEFKDKSKEGLNHYAADLASSLLSDIERLIPEAKDRTEEHRRELLKLCCKSDTSVETVSGYLND